MNIRIIMKDKRFSRVIQLSAYTIIFMIVFSAIDIALTASGKGYMINEDGVYQGYSMVGYIQSLVRKRSFFSGFDYTIGLGEDNLLTLTFHGFLNPIHWIMAILFSKLPTYLLYKYILVFKFYLGGISFLLFTNKRGRSKVLSIGVSMIYVFSAWSMTCGMYFFGFYDVIIALPLLILGIDNIFENKKGISFWFILAMVYIGMQGFYFLFWQCLIGGGYFIIKLLWKRQHLGVRMMRYVVNCSCSLLLTAPILLPQTYWFLLGTRNARTWYPIKQLMPNYHELKTFLRSFMTPTASAWTHYLLVGVALWGLAIFIFKYKRYKFDFCILIVSILLVITPGAGLLLNGGGYLSERGYYFVWLVLAYVILCGLEELIFNFDWKTAVISAILVFIYNIAILCLEKEFREYHLTNCIIFIGIFVFTVMGSLAARWDLEKRKMVLSCVIMLSIALLCRRNISFIWSSDNKCQAEYADLQRADLFVNIEELIEDENQDYSEYAVNDADWFRVESDSFLSLNEGMLRGMCTTYEYFSLCNPWIQRFWNQIAGLEIQNKVGLPYCQSEIIRKFLGVRYYSVNGTNVIDEDVQQLTIGYENYITEEQIKDWSLSDKENVLLKYIILQSEPGNCNSFNNNGDEKNEKLLLQAETKLLHNKVISKINMNRTGYVLYTIPYSKGWSVIADGEDVPLYVADYGFIGIELEKGEHIIELIYRRPLQKEGWIAFGIGMLVLLTGAMYGIWKAKEQCIDAF